MLGMLRAEKPAITSPILLTEYHRHEMLVIRHQPDIGVDAITGCGVAL
jgi:hypothetical protein